jgi:hypothetical protein
MSMFFGCPEGRKITVKLGGQVKSLFDLFAGSVHSVDP